MTKLEDVQTILLEVYPEISSKILGSRLEISLETSNSSYHRYFSIPKNRTAGEEVTLIINDIVRTLKSQEVAHKRISEFDTIL